MRVEVRDSSAKRCVLSGIKVDGRAELSENMVDRLAAQTQGGVSSFPPTVCTWSGGIVRDRHLFGEMGIANATLLIPCTHTHHAFVAKRSELELGLRSSTRIFRWRMEWGCYGKSRRVDPCFREIFL